MKRLLAALATILLAGNVYAAQQDITAVSVPETLGGYRSAVNARLVDIDENFDELYGQSDSDVIAALNCTTNQIAKWNGTAWACAADVDTNTTYTAGTGLTLVGTEFRNTVTNSDTIAALSCTSGQIAKWNGTAWACATDAVAEAGTGDDLGDATAGDVAALFSGEGDYLKTDGTQGTPAGTEYTAGDNITITDGVIASTATGVPDGTTDGDILEWDTDSWSAVAPAEVTFAGSVSYDSETNTVTGTDTTYTAGTGLTLTGTEFASTATDDQNASEVSVDATGFTGNLESTDTDVQTALETLDALTIGSGDAADIGVTDTGGYYDGTNVETVLAELGAQIESLLAAFEAAGLNDFTFTPDTPPSYPFYSAAGTFNLDFEITDTSTTYAVTTVEYSIDGAAYESTDISDEGAGIWRVAFASLANDDYTIQLEACDDKETPNCEESSVFAFTVDTIDPVVDLTP
jgi:hypothetical protein